MSRVPRIRMFAGPNGSGKSCLKNHVNARWIGVYINADDLERELSSKSGVLLERFNLKLSDEEFFEKYQRSSLAAKVDTGKVKVTNGVFRVPKKYSNSYYAAILASVIRDRLIERKVSFSFETVMSHESKVNLLVEAKKKGFRTYLYYIATVDPAINLNRVALRVNQGGHPVPDEKVVSRYHRSLALLKPAIKATDRCYVFDNSGEKEIWIAEAIDGKELTLKEQLIPRWFVDSLGLDVGGE